MKNYGKLLIVILIIILVWIIVFVGPNKLHQIDFYDKIKDKFKTGDILLFSCKKHSNPLKHVEYYMRTNLLGSIFGHVGIILRENDNLYMVECTDIGHIGEKHAHYINNQKKGGVRIIKLEYLLKKYRKNYGGIFGVRFISEAIPNDIFFRELNKFKNKIFEDKKVVSLLAFTDICVSHGVATNFSKKFSDNDKIICSQFAYELLYQCGVVKDYQSQLFWPHLFDDGRIFDNLQIVPYSPINGFIINTYSK